ncbi:hypothetical protein P4O66_000041 [Electrophorus voltai]|uniref:Uncharacterized protein n=1 Tax=Electrophorus voltai TaxID=2609070 RepID=A0AAD9E6G3_9TELE|nr:hypothetical protein P4O66_000041 [Electrophorus voltai]
MSPDICGLRSSACFLDTGLANKLALLLVPLDKPLPIDGWSLEPGVVSHHTRPIALRVSSHTEQIAPYIIHAPNLQLILGYPWLQRHNPHVDWLTRSVLSWGLSGQSSCLQLPKSRSGSGHGSGCLDLSQVPQEYWDLGEAFSKQKAQLLPPHCPYGMAINLLLGSSPPKGHLFCLLGLERQATDKYIQESLALGFIWPSTSPAGTGFFFVGKKDGGLHPCIDYQGLNKMTIKDRYPLPLVTSAFETLQQACFY